MKNKFTEEDFMRFAKEWTGLLNFQCELGVPVRTEDGLSIAVRNHPYFHELRYDPVIHGVTVYNRSGNVVMDFLLV